VGDGQPVAVVLVYSGAFDVPDEVAVHDVGDLGCLDEDCSVDGLDIGEDVLRYAGIYVGVVHPDSRGGCDIRYDVLADEGSVVEQQLYSSGFPVSLDVQPADVVDSVVLYERVFDGQALDSSRSAFVEFVVADDHIAGILACASGVRSPGSSGLIGPCADFDADGIDLSNDVLFDDPVMAAVCEYRSDSCSWQAVARLLEDEAFEADEAEVGGGGLEDVLPGGDFKFEWAWIDAAQRVDMERFGLLIDPVRAGGLGEVGVCCLLG